MEYSKTEGRQLSVEEAKDRVDTSDMTEDAREALKTWVQYKYEMNQPAFTKGGKWSIVKLIGWKNRYAKN